MAQAQAQSGGQIPHLRHQLARCSPQLKPLVTWRWLVHHDERSYSFLDATSFTTLRWMRIGQALSFDGNFALPVSWRFAADRCGEGDQAIICREWRHSCGVAERRP